MGIEIQILNLIQGLRTPFLDMIMPKITFLGNNGYLWVLLTVILLLIPKTRKVGVTMALAILIESILCNLVLKPLAARTRPCDVNTAIQLIIKRPKDFSFPSGHTAASITATTVLFLTVKKRFAVCALIVSLLIAFSRLYLYVHYPTDVLGGAFLGLLSGWAAHNIIKYIESKNKLTWLG